VVDVLLGGAGGLVAPFEDGFEDVACPDVLDLVPNGLEQLFERAVGGEALPVAVVSVDVVVEVRADGCAVVAPGVAAEEFVAAPAREDYLDELGGELRGVEVGVALADAGLFEVPCEAGHDALHVAGLEDHFVVFGFEEVGHVFGLFALVEAQFEAGGGVEVEAAGEGFHVGQFFGGDGGDAAGVHASAEVGAHVDVAHQLAFDGLAKEEVQFFGVFVLGTRGFGLAEVEVPVAFDLERARCGTEREERSAPCGEEADVLEERLVGEDVLEGKVFQKGFEVEFARDGAVGEDGFLLRAEEEGVSGEDVVERFDAVTVAGEEERGARLVPEGEGEHAVEALDAGGAPLDIGVERDFGVGARGEDVTERFERFAEFAEIVDFAVEGDGEVAAGGDAGLVSGGGEVDDGEPPVSEAEEAVDEEPFSVRSAMGDGVGHFSQGDGGDGAAVEVEDSGDAAHYFDPSAFFLEAAIAAELQMECAVDVMSCLLFGQAWLWCIVSECAARFFISSNFITRNAFCQMKVWKIRRTSGFPTSSVHQAFSALSICSIT